MLQSEVKMDVTSLERTQRHWFIVRVGRDRRWSQLVQPLLQGGPAPTSSSQLKDLQQLCKMLLNPGIYYFPWEINSGPVRDGETLRTFGRLHCYDLAQSEAVLTAQHNSVQHQVRVCTKFVEPFQAQLGFLYVALGDMEQRDGEGPVLKARVLTCVEGMNLSMLEQAIREQRKYFQDRQGQVESSAS
ncbi:CST complex subunit TEN1 isoform X2 [Alligator mississippiensis]|uniref:CST complex subunit TEN1 isoform X2 n=1 Tax=Alligator mississippiensis TaxID=8496 RepID=UPI00090757EA|nr:CST complex subunit TEN1 isoform X2 [Alligator mississippiensis]